MRTDGKALYGIPAEQWVSNVGFPGQTLFNHLQESEYGIVRISCSIKMSRSGF